MKKKKPGKNNNIFRLFFLLLLFIFLPAFGQVSTQQPSDLEIAEKKFDRSLQRVQAAIDSLQVYISKIDSSLPKDTIKKKYHIENLNGTTKWWVFNYTVQYNKWTDQNDTIFRGVNKYVTY